MAKIHQNFVDFTTPKSGKNIPVQNIKICKIASKFQIQPEKIAIRGRKQVENRSKTGSKQLKMTKISEKIVENKAKFPRFGVKIR